MSTATAPALRPQLLDQLHRLADLLCSPILLDPADVEHLAEARERCQQADAAVRQATIENDRRTLRLRIAQDHLAAACHELEQATDQPDAHERMHRAEEATLLRDAEAAEHQAVLAGLVTDAEQARIEHQLLLVKLLELTR